MKFSERLKKLRNEKGVYQKELANILDVSRPTITQYEQGKRKPDHETLTKIANYFDVSIDYLLGRTDQKNPNGNLPEGVKELLSEEEQEFIIELMQKEDFHMFLREARGASDEDLATAVRVFKAVKEGKETGEQL